MKTIKLILALAYAGLPLGAQTPAKPTAYDVASVKVNDSGENGMQSFSNYGHIDLRNASLKQLLQYAYGIQQERISGVSGPLESTRFDVSAKMLQPDEGVFQQMTPRETRAMLQPILQERFKLKVHIVPKVMAVYELTKLRGELKFQATPGPRSHGSSIGISNRNNVSVMTAHHMSMDDFAETLSNQVQRDVVDKTGLMSRYEITLRWFDERVPGQAPAEPVPVLFTALQEQLGLKLAAAKREVQTLVVDHVEMPQEN